MPRVTKEPAAVRWAYGGRKVFPAWLADHGITPKDLHLDEWLPCEFYGSARSHLRAMCELAKIPKPRGPRFITAWVVPDGYFNLDRPWAAGLIQAYAAEIEMIVANKPKWVDCSVRLLQPTEPCRWFGTIIRFEDEGVNP